MDKWELVNKFRTLVEGGFVAPLECPDCRNKVVFLIGEDDDPILYCPWDGGTFKTGAGFYSDMRAVVKEHYVD